MRLDELQARVARKVQDSSYDPATIRAFLNDALKAVAAEKNIFLPDLKTSLTLSTATGADYVAISSGSTVFLKGLYWVQNATYNHKVKVYRSLDQLMGTFPDDLGQSGSIKGVAEQGGSLYYLRRPTSSESLRVHFYQKPTELSLASDEPSILPDHLQAPLLVNHACWNIFDEIYEGDPEGQRTVEGYQNKYAFYVEELRRFLGPPAVEQQMADDVRHWEYIDWDQV